ncbi:hypothetical protein [Paenibacillus sp. Leaf72]|uniref:hypothetical protein n=1 Tax=Paenibacillus sp. Leaf72 TaxID=1736234 RepID=UPI0006F75711|nr:hypothetical protein [Paenibacillus sp. Leaf72]KQO15795.1 hypothetical protein ASF12_27650 [Paenibacillus sp. Leaf72]
MADEGLLKKLRYKEGQAAKVWNAPEGYAPGIAEDTSGAGPYGFAQLFVHHAAQVREQLPIVLPQLEEDAVFWITYPKQSAKAGADINRDSLAALVMELTPYRPVSNAAVDEVWSALRFRHTDKVKKK